MERESVRYDTTNRVRGVRDAPDDSHTTSSERVKGKLSAHRSSHAHPPFSIATVIQHTYGLYQHYQLPVFPLPPRELFSTFSFPTAAGRRERASSTEWISRQEGWPAPVPSPQNAYADATPPSSPLPHPIGGNPTRGDDRSDVPAAAGGRRGWRGADDAFTKRTSEREEGKKQETKEEEEEILWIPAPAEPFFHYSSPSHATTTGGRFLDAPGGTPQTRRPLSIPCPITYAYFESLWTTSLYDAWKRVSTTARVSLSASFPHPGVSMGLPSALSSAWVAKGRDSRWRKEGEGHRYCITGANDRPLYALHERLGRKEDPSLVFGASHGATNRHTNGVA